MHPAPEGEDPADDVDVDAQSDEVPADAPANGATTAAASDSVGQEGT